MGLVFPIAPDPLAILVAFVTVTIGLPHSEAEVAGQLPKRDCAHHVRRVGLDWIFVATTNNGLAQPCGIINVWPGIGKDLYQARQVSDVATHGRSRMLQCWPVRRDLAALEERGHSRYFGANRFQPQTEPASFEAGVAG